MSILKERQKQIQVHQRYLEQVRQQLCDESVRFDQSQNESHLVRNIDSYHNFLPYIRVGSTRKPNPQLINRQLAEQRDKRVKQNASRKKKEQKNHKPPNKDRRHPSKNHRTGPQAPFVNKS